MVLTWGRLPEWAKAFSGSGYGYGDGSGDGSGYRSWQTAVEMAADKLHEYADCFLAFWKSNMIGHPCNGGSHSKPSVPGLICREQGPLELCSRGTLHATLNPDEWKGERLWIVALRGEVARDGNKVGALEREIICEVEGVL